MADPISATINVAGGLIQGAQSKSSARKIQAHEHRWQEKMRETAYQTAVADLEAAGLNPMLAYQNGSASSGVGSAMTSAQAGNTNPNIDLMETITARKQQKNIDKQTELINEQIDKTKAETQNIETNTTLQDAQTINTNVNSISQDMANKLNAESGTSKESWGPERAIQNVIGRIFGRNVSTAGNSAKKTYNLHGKKYSY